MTTNGRRVSLISSSLRNVEGHCRVPKSYRREDGYRLGGWAAVQRRSQNAMDPDRRKRLEALSGWSWNIVDDRWEKGFSHLKEFAERSGHCRVPVSYKTNDGYRVGDWVRTQRKTKDTMDSDCRQRLEALSGWSWSIVDDQWEEGFSHLKQFAERNGHCRVPSSYKSEDGYFLGSWVGEQRQNKDTMSSDRRKRLEALSGWSWNTRDDRWEDGFSHLKEFADQKGHCRVAYLYETEDGYRLGKWVSKQRKHKGPRASATLSGIAGLGLEG